MSGTRSASEELLRLVHPFQGSGAQRQTSQGKLETGVALRPLGILSALEPFSCSQLQIRPLHPFLDPPPHIHTWFLMEDGFLLSLAKADNKKMNRSPAASRSTRGQGYTPAELVQVRSKDL